jgi:hypothetical protein
MERRDYKMKPEIYWIGEDDRFKEYIEENILRNNVEFHEFDNIGSLKCDSNNIGKYDAFLLIDLDLSKKSEDCFNLFNSTDFTKKFTGIIIFNYYHDKNEIEDILINKPKKIQIIDKFKKKNVSDLIENLIIEKYPIFKLHINSEFDNEIINKKLKFKSMADQISETTNKIETLLSKAEEGRKEKEKLELYREAIIRSRRLLRSVPFEEIIEQYKKLNDDAMAEIDYEKDVLEYVASDMLKFEEFLEKEQELLRFIGLKHGISRLIINELRRNLDDFRNNRIPTENLENAINKFQDHIENLLEKNIEELRNMNIKTRLLKGLGGATLLAVNIAGSTLLGPVTAGASGGAGLTFVFNSFHH